METNSSTHTPCFRLELGEEGKDPVWDAHAHAHAQHGEIDSDIDIDIDIDCYRDYENQKEREEDSLLQLPLPLPSPRHSLNNTSFATTRSTWGHTDDSCTGVRLPSFPETAAKRRNHVTAVKRYGFLCVVALALLRTTVIVLTDSSNSVSNSNSDSNTLLGRFLQDGAGTGILADLSDTIDNSIDPGGNASVDADTNQGPGNPIIDPGIDASEGDPTTEDLLLPTIVVEQTNTLSPSFSFVPTGALTTVRPSQSPTTSAPSISPAPTMSRSPSNRPTETPSSMPTETPSISPSSAPSLSVRPSLSPSVSTSPTLSGAPTQTGIIIQATLSPTFPSETATEVNIVMIIENVPNELQTLEDIEVWQNVTNDHMEGFYQVFNELFPKDFPINITKVDTMFVSQEPIGEAVDDEGNENEGGGGGGGGGGGDPPTEIQAEKQLQLSSPQTPAPASAEDENPSLATAPATATATATAPDTTTDGTVPTAANPGPITLRITYNQTIHGTSTHFGDDTAVGLNDQEELFILPFVTDSFDYSVRLAEAITGWEDNWIYVEDVDPGERETSAPSEAPTQGPRLSASQTSIISASIVIGACLIVVFLLWDRSHKSSDVRHNDHRQAGSHAGFSNSNSNSSSAAAAAAAAGMKPPLEWKAPLGTANHNHKNEDDHISTRSAPAHLRRGDQHLQRSTNNNPAVEARQQQSQLPSFDDGGQLKGGVNSHSRHGVARDNSNSYITTRTLRDRSSHSRESSISNTPEDGSPKLSSNDEQSATSYGIPKHVPLSIRAISGGESSVMTFVSERSMSSRGLHQLPPLPPQPTGHTTSTSATTNDSSRHRGVSAENNRRSSGDHSHNHDTSQQQLPPSQYQRRRGPMGMKVSSISDDSATDLSMVTANFRSDNELGSDEFAAATHHDFPPPIPDEDLDLPGSAFASPLHIPDEEALSNPSGFGSMSTRPESPIPTMLGLAPTRNSIMTPSQAGFDMKIQDLE